MTVTLQKNNFPKQSELLKKFGAPSYSGKFKTNNMVLVKLPYTMWMDEIKITKTFMNKVCADSLVRVLTYLWEYYDKDPEKIKAAGLDVFSGTWNIRPMRGGSKMSTHGYGLAIDINAPHNALGAIPGKDKLSFTKDSPVVKAFEAEGWTWGGHWSRPDGMHFQAAKVD